MDSRRIERSKMKKVNRHVDYFGWKEYLKMHQMAVFNVNKVSFYLFYCRWDVVEGARYSMEQTARRPYAHRHDDIWHFPLRIVQKIDLP